jgi:hypothetical protein
MLLKKYLETGCCGSIICGDLPPDYKDWLGKIYMVHINDEMTDSEILKALETNLANKKLLEEKAKENVEFFNKIADYKTGYDVLINKLGGEKKKLEIDTIVMGKRKYLFIELFKSNNEDRQKEYYKVLENNINNNDIDMIYVFIDNDDILKDINKNNKLKFINIDSRLTFKTCFEYIRDNIENDIICIISNADIYYDETLKKLDQLDMNNLVVSLLRYDVATDGTYKLHNNGSAGVTNDSQDCWILKTPIKVPSNTNFYFGRLGCDNRIAYEFYDAGYDLINCPMDIKSYHLHLVDYRNYDKSSVLKGTYLLLNVSKLEDIKGDYDKYYNFKSDDKVELNKIKNRKVKTI